MDLSKAFDTVDNMILIKKQIIREKKEEIFCGLKAT